MKRKIVNMGTIGIVVIILLVGVLNYKQAAETKMKKIETEENRVRENKTNYTNEQDSSNICEMTEEDVYKRQDKHRAEYYKYHTGREWTDARNYDLCLDSSKLGYERCVDEIISYMKVRFPEN